MRFLRATFRRQPRAIIGKEHSHERARQQDRSDDAGQAQAGVTLFQRAHPAKALTTLEQRQVGLHGLGACVTSLTQTFAGFQDDFMKFERFTARLLDRKSVV